MSIIGLFIFGLTVIALVAHRTAEQYLEHLMAEREGSNEPPHDLGVWKMPRRRVADYEIENALQYETVAWYTFLASCLTLALVTTQIALGWLGAA